MSSFFRTLPETIQQPVALAMLGSVGAHLLFFATLPAFTSSNEPRPDLEVRRVRLLEPPQTPAQIASSRLGLPPVPNPPNRRVQIPPIGQTTSPVPNPLYTIPSLTPLPIPVPSQQQISSQDRFNELLRRLAARQQQTATIKIPKPPVVQPDQKTTPTQPTSPGEMNLKEADPSDVVRSLPIPSAADLNPIAQANPIAPTSPTTQPRPDAEPNPTPTPDTAETAALARNERLLAATRYDPDGTTDQARLKRTQDFTQALVTKGTPWEYIRKRQAQEPLREEPYPLSFPLNDYKQHPVAVAVRVGKDGKPLPDTKPELLGSTGYQILDDKAIELIQKEANQPGQFNAIEEDKIRVFVYEFQFKAPNSGTASVPQQQS